MARIQRHRRYRAFKYFCIIYILIIGIGYLGIKEFRKSYIINISDSITKGVYRLTDMKEEDYIKGTIVQFPIPSNAEEYIHGRNYLPKNVKTLSKMILGVNGDKIEIRSSVNRKVLYINDNSVGGVSKYDGLGLPIPQMESKVLEENEFFVYGIHPKSFDSRYFGTIKKEDILKKATLVFSF